MTETPEVEDGTEPSGSDADYWIPEGDCGRLLENQVRVVPLVGAGVSEAAGLPGSTELASDLSDNFGSATGAWTDPSDLRVVADDIVNNDPARSQELRRHVAEFWTSAVDKVEPEPIVRDLVRIPSRLLVTFNYDCLLEKAAEAEGLECQSLAGHYDLGPFEALARAASPPAKLTVLHLHGSARNFQTIVIDATGYRELESELVKSLFRELMANRRVCFIGTRVDESRLIADYQANVNSEQPHPIFVTQSGAEAISRRGRLYEVAHGVKPCILPSHAHLRGLVRHLARPLPEPAEKSTQATGEEPSPDYVPTVVTLCSELDEGTTDYFAQLSLGRRFSRFGESEVTFLTEDEVIAGNRNLILGAPGSGKSELLRFSGRKAPSGQQPIFIRLLDVSLDVAEPSRRLTRWASVGRPLRGDTAVSPETLKSETFHFLLDGLDEVAPPVQELLAQHIRNLAEAFPQHSFSVTSRPVAAAEILREDWRCLTLRPGSVWQRRYLDHRGVELNALLEQLENGRDLVDVLKLPFFLTRVVQLNEAGELAGLDLWGIIRKLIDLALEAEDAREMLPVSPAEARRWLQRAALAIHLQGQVVMRFEDVDKVPLDGDADAERAEICEALVQRAMLHEQTEGYVFVHRILGEALAAEALAELEPRDELLAAIAPVVSDTIAGTRADWRMPLSFVLPHRSIWREAIRERDPMQWARSVPSDAPVAERREAARMIWETYVEWDIWIWDYDLPDVVQDVTALARLLRAGDQEALVDDIRAGIDGPTGRMQGNAIKVLSLTEEDLESDLRRVLEDDDREAVVRRKAAIAAANRDLHDLLPLIIHRAINPAEEVETQDCVIAAMDLARDEELVDVVRQLLAHSDARALALGRVERSLRPREIVSLMRDYAAVDPDPYSTERDLFVDAAGRLEDVDPEAVKEGGYVAGAWQLNTEEVQRLLDRDHEAALAGIAAAVDEARGGWFSVFQLLRMFTAEELEGAGAPEIVVARRRDLDDPEHQKRVDAAIKDAEREQAELESRRPPTLRELLQRERDDETTWLIQYNASRLADQVKELAVSEQDDLRVRISEWQKDKAFTDAITWKRRGEDGNSWSIENWANALLWLGPTVDLPLEPRRWAEIAVSEVIFDSQYDWLRQTATAESTRLVAEICESNEARVWDEVLRATPDPLPDELVEALVDKLEEVDPRGSYRMRAICDRLVQSSRLDALRRLAEKSNQLEEATRPHRARAGDAEAVEQMLDELIEKLGNGLHPSDDEFAWLQGAGDERYLPKLFECLRLVQTVPAKGERFVTTASPLINLIQLIGGEKAVAGYDELLATGDSRFSFLRLQRQAVADAQLAELGVYAASTAAGVAGVPTLS